MRSILNYNINYISVPKCWAPDVPCLLLFNLWIYFLVIFILLSQMSESYFFSIARSVMFGCLNRLAGWSLTQMVYYYQFTRIRLTYLLIFGQHSTKVYYGANTVFGIKKQYIYIVNMLLFYRLKWKIKRDVSLILQIIVYLGTDYNNILYII